jgi:hypothetical protein
VLWSLDNNHTYVILCKYIQITHEELDGLAVSAIAEAKQRSQRSVIGWVAKIYYLELLRVSKGTLSRLSLLYLQLLAPINLHWACVVGYGPFSLWVIHKKGLCPSCGDINRLMMMMSNSMTVLAFALEIRAVHSPKCIV